MNEEEKLKRKKIIEQEKKIIELFEEQGTFDKDSGNNPETIPLQPDKVDYLGKKFSSKVSTAVANKVAQKFINKLIKNKQLIIKEINGMDYLNSIQTGFVITCNHFNPFDNFAVHKVIEQSVHNKKRKLYKVIREGNYTNFGGLYGYFFRHCNTLPLSSIKKTMMNFMSAVNTILKRGDMILIYPEQSLWLDYQKPKPLKNGAFKFAVNNNVPVLPIFITFEDSNVIIDDEPVKEYTINILPPIYPDEKFNSRENVEIMKKENFRLWKETYELKYNRKLEYTTKTNLEFLND